MMVNKIDKDTIERVLVMADNFGIPLGDCTCCAYEQCCSEQDSCYEGIAKFLYDMQEGNELE